MQPDSTVADKHIFPYSSITGLGTFKQVHPAGSALMHAYKLLKIALCDACFLLTTSHRSIRAPSRASARTQPSFRPARPSPLTTLSSRPGVPIWQVRVQGHLPTGQSARAFTHRSECKGIYPHDLSVRKLSTSSVGRSSLHSPGLTQPAHLDHRPQIDRRFCPTPGHRSGLP